MKNNKTKGNMGEKLAGEYLEKKGYSIVRTNYKGKVGEIDIIAKKDDYLVFVEVKYRVGLNKGFPKEAVTPLKQKRIIETAYEYISKENPKEENYRFDVVEVLKCEDEKIYVNHIENAFWIEEW